MELEKSYLFVCVFPTFLGFFFIVFEGFCIFDGFFKGQKMNTKFCG